MQKYATILEIVRMRQEKQPYDLCQSRLGVSSSVVTYVSKRFKQLRLSLDELEDMQPEEAEELFYPQEQRRQKKIPLPDFEAMYERIAAKGSKVNATLLWNEYRQDNPDGYGYTQFLKYFKEYMARVHGPSATKMIVQRVPGERMYVDWMGDRPELLADEKTGELKEVHFFCATLGVSSLAYAEAFTDESLPNFVQGIVNALKYYGACPAYVVPDNLRAAVTKHDKDKLELTAACRDLEKFYDFIILPTPPRKPKGKATVEHFVGFAERRLVEILKENGPYPTISAVHAATLPILDDLNNRLERGRESTRYDMFKRIDLPNMKPLPDETFTAWDYRWVSAVPNTYHVSYDGHQYSVPYTLTGKPVVIKASISDIVICDENNRVVATHKRSYTSYPRNTVNPAHMPPAHRFYQDVNEMDGQKYRDWAASIGPSAKLMVEHILSSSEFEAQMYESCTSLMYHAKGVPPEVVESAASECLSRKQTACSQFRNKITEKMKAQTDNASTAVPDHSNMRGKEYFT